MSSNQKGDFLLFCTSENSTIGLHLPCCSWIPNYCKIILRAMYYYLKQKQISPSLRRKTFGSWLSLSLAQDMTQHVL